MAYLKRQCLRLGLALAMVGWLSPAASGAAGSGLETAAVGDLATQRELLASQREELASVSVERVAQEVRRRAAELEVKVPARELVEMLTRRAELLLEVEECRLAGAGCAALELEPELELATLEASFVKRVGFSMLEFRSGQLDAARRSGFAAAPLQPFAAPGIIVPGGSTRTDPEFCACTFYISNKDRWINRWWGLECNGHASHGVCSNNVDSAHTAGAGAMTGSIEAFFGEQHLERHCPDDHRTCFKGPMPSKPGGGEWTNVCNCDTVHSQWSNPYQKFYGGDLTDAVLVSQATFYGVADGSCKGQSVYVYEGIKENDPICCDDPMGTLGPAVAYLTDGTTSKEVATAVTNCNGGSQSGVPPYCGQFGATIGIVANCQTQEDDGYASCYGRCGQVLPDATCNCDFSCQDYGDCCSDYCNACSAPPDGDAFPCSVGGY